MTVWFSRGTRAVRKWKTLGQQQRHICDKRQTPQWNNRHEHSRKKMRTDEMQQRGISNPERSTREREQLNKYTFAVWIFNENRLRIASMLVCVCVLRVSESELLFVRCENLKMCHGNYRVVASFPSSDDSLAKTFSYFFLGGIKDKKREENAKHDKKINGNIFFSIFQVKNWCLMSHKYRNFLSCAHHIRMAPARPLTLSATHLVASCVTWTTWFPFRRGTWVYAKWISVFLWTAAPWDENQNSIDTCRTRHTQHTHTQRKKIPQRLQQCVESEKRFTANQRGK